ncbi:signal transduction histidine kinase [Rhizobium sp. BK251]|nr:signal transduction histidine kinase [Rhizobium sp. BK251]
MACGRIADLDRPAYVKNSELRYVAVNEPYAHFFGLDISDFIGRRTSEMFAGAEARDREDKERRALVFGTEELASCLDPSGSERFEFQIESFIPSQDRAYILGLVHEKIAGRAIGEGQPSNANRNADLERIQEALETVPYPLGIFADDGRTIVANAAYRAGEDDSSAAPAPASSSRAPDPGAELSSSLAEGAFDLIDVGVCVYDPDNRLAYANAPWREFYRPLIGEIDIGTDLRTVLERLYAFRSELAAQKGLPNADRESWIGEWLENFSHPFHETVEKTLSGRWLRMINKRLPDGSLIGLRVDVTELKERASELQRLLARAEAADRAKSEFLANMSHEIRTPMNGVLGMAELLAKTDLDARQKTFVDVIAKSGNALLTIINDVLDFSKIDAGQMTLRPAPFDPAEAVEDVASLLSSAAAEKDVELLVRLAPTLPSMVTGDAGRFRQIVTNLVGNAVKFTERGHVLVEMDCRPGEDEETTLSLRVEDTGIGISVDKLDIIFEKFSQADSSSTRRHEGTGLGLAITAGLVNLFGGHIEVESELAQGSVFTVHLPFKPAAARGDPRFLPVNVKGARILVIDDNEINRRIVTEQLQGWGFDGFAAEDGATGLAIIEEALALGLTIDAVVLDYQMPVMNGAEVSQLIRADSRFNAIPIIFLTSMDIAGADREFAALNGQAHLMKPARANVLRNTIVEVVRAARMPPTAAPIAGNAAGERTPIVVEPEKERQPLAGAVAPTGILDVLVAEDNEVNQIVFTQILQATGLSFLVVDNGLKAIDAWDRYRPRLVMMDVSMPVMNGHEATRAIRSRELAECQGRHVPIVGVTSHAMESDRDLCLEAGMDDYISKPISPELLEAKISRWLGSAFVRSGRSGL